VTDQIDQLATAYHDFRQGTWPTVAHLQGDYRFADRFEDVSRATEDADIATSRAFADRADAVSEDGLDAQQRITRAMIAWDAQSRADHAEARMAEIGIDPISGIQTILPIYLPKLGLPTDEIADRMVGKFASIAREFGNFGQRHRDGLAKRRVSPRFAIDRTVQQLDRWLATPVADDPLLQLAPTPVGFDRDAWLGRLRRVVERDIRPAASAYRDLLRDDLAPHGRSDDQVGLTWIPDGDDAYGRLIRSFTTVDLSAQAIHDIGLAQIEKLAGEYRVIGRDVMGTSDLTTILDRMRNDPALHHTNGAEIVSASKVAMAKARAAMGEWFGVLPKSDCDVEEVKTGSIAYYFPPAKDGSRGGVFFMNTSDPTGWGRFDIESTSYHEGIPGHHLQLAIATELEGVAEFRKWSFIAAYGEGWGLYAERLADEMGLYSTPMDRLGMLSADSMRASRLVVDTGIHALGWSRRQAIDYMLANSPMTESRITAERPLHRPAGPGARVHDRAPGDPADPGCRRSSPGEPLRHQGVPRRGAGQRRRAVAAVGRHRRGVGRRELVLVGRAGWVGCARVGRVARVGRFRRVARRGAVAVPAVDAALRDGVRLGQQVLHAGPGVGRTDDAQPEHAGVVRVREEGVEGRSVGRGGHVGREHRREGLAAGPDVQAVDAGPVEVGPIVVVVVRDDRRERQQVVRLEAGRVVEEEVAAVVDDLVNVGGRFQDPPDQLVLRHVASFGSASGASVDAVPDLAACMSRARRRFHQWRAAQSRRTAADASGCCQK
jgi:uncharacterized protein (DUF885 family)